MPVPAELQSIICSAFVVPVSGRIQIAAYWCCDCGWMFSPLPALPLGLLKTYLRDSLLVTIYFHPPHATATTNSGGGRRNSFREWLRWRLTRSPPAARSRENTRHALACF